MPAFRVFGLAGLVVAVVTAGVVAAATRVPVAAVGAVTAAALVTSVGVLAVRASLGSDDLVWSEHEAVVLAVAVVAGVAVRRPLALLDTVAIGLMPMLAIGRVGCLLAGCCHGRPCGRRARLTVHYSARHSAVGFPDALVGVPVLPVPLAEAAAALALATTGAVLVARGAAEGAALVAVVGGRAAVRLALEQWRGDNDQGTWGPLTLPQVWATAVVILLIGATADHLVPWGWWTAAPVAGLAVTAWWMRPARSTSGPGRT